MAFPPTEEQRQMPAGLPLEATIERAFRSPRKNPGTAFCRAGISSYGPFEL